MRSFDKIFVVVMIMILLVFIGANIFLVTSGSAGNGRPYQVEISRLALEIEDKGPENIDIEGIDLSACHYVKRIERLNNDSDRLSNDSDRLSNDSDRLSNDSDRLSNDSDGLSNDSDGLNNDNERINNGSGEFYHVDSDYVIREINGDIYRFDYNATEKRYGTGIILSVNVILAVMYLVLLGVLVFVRLKILVPFARLTDVPYELARGNLSTPIKEDKSRFFGRFIWGVNLLRENIELQKKRELNLHKSRKTLLLSLSHDIKTPISAIKLYAKALSRELYSDKDKQREIAENINAKADEIEGFVSQIINASREDFLNLEVDMGEFFVSELMNSIYGFYKEKLALVRTDFNLKDYSDCLLKGDLDKSIEVVQNIMENAIKYGDGKSVEIKAYEEEGCMLVEVRNSGCTLPQTELPHIFESFWRGSNSGRVSGSGLGLYICRQLICKMGGEIFAQIQDGLMIVTMVFAKA